MSIPQHGPSVTEMRPGERGFVAGLGIESQDLVTISEKMARGILGAEPISNAKGKPVVVLEPINNDTRFPIDKDIFPHTHSRGAQQKCCGQNKFCRARAHG